MGWDSQVPEDLAQKFFKWREQLPLLSGVKIPRCLLAENFNHDNMTLHVFSDASKCAYGAVVYLRVVTDGCASIQLVQAKFHVAPVKPVTIPRLELIGCCIGARLAKSVKDSLNLMQIPTYYWTDSMTALSWIQRDEQWGVFVRNRVEEIRKLSDVQSWFHVPGELNPADLPSWGCSGKNLLQSQWWEGPSWLLSEEWPHSNLECDEEAINMEKKKAIVSSLANTEVPDRWYLKYFSNYKSVVNMIGWILRFSKNV